MTEERSFMSVGLPAHHNNPPAQAHSHSHHDDQHDFPQGYPHHPDEDPYPRRSPSNASYPPRSWPPPARPSSQAYGGPMPLQLPSLNGVFHDPTRSLYASGTPAVPPGSYGGPSPSDENDIDAFRLPLNTAVASSHSHSPYDYHPHHQQDFHHERHNSHSQASYRSHHPHLPDHPSSAVTSTIPNNPSPGPNTYSHSRQHHPHQQMVPSMMYNHHPSEVSSSAFNRSYSASGSQSYANSRSSPSLSPQLEATPAPPPATVKAEERHAPAVSLSTSRSTTSKRREKPKIELAADQPLTTQGKPRARVYVACVQCRTRKIRCDGAKPVCHNCFRRQAPASTSASSIDATSLANTATSPTSATSPTHADPMGPCCYDSAPKRRGPDKNPGSRQRISHAQRELDTMATSGTADGGKVKRRRRRDTNALPAAAAAGSAGAPQDPGVSSSRIHEPEAVEKQLTSGIPRNLTVNTNLSGGGNDNIPTSGAAHSSVSSAIPSSNTSMAIGNVVGSGTVSEPISGPRSATDRIPPSDLHMPEAHEYGQQAMTNPNVTHHMRSPDMYHPVSGQGHMRVAHMHQLGHSYSHTADARVSAERTHGHSNMPPNGMQRGYPSHDNPYSMPVHMQAQAPPQTGQQQSRSHRTDVPRLISATQEYPHTHSQHQTLSHSHHISHSHPQTHLTTPLGYLTHPYDQLVLPPPTATIVSIDEHENDSDSAGSGAVGAIGERTPDIAAEPSVQFAREIWWDTLIGMYYVHSQPQSSAGQYALSQPLSPGLRESLAQSVTADLKFLFRASNYWFSFVNVPRFFSRLLDPAQRPSLQPSFILAALACANLIKSSEQEAGREGRAWALTLLDTARASLEASMNSRWIDESLVQASWMIVFFEISAHPAHRDIRVRSALAQLDNLIRSLSMSVLDGNDERTSRFVHQSVPVVPSSPSAIAGTHPSPRGSWASPMSALLSATPGLSPTSHHSLGRRTGSPTTSLVSATNAPSCSCGSLTLGHNWAHANDLTPLWLMTPAWNPDASDAEIRKEECRRVVWSAVTLLAGYTSFVAAMNAAPSLELSLMDASNIALLFPAETLPASLSSNQADNSLTKSTVWALYMRTMLLWHSCLRMRWDTHQSDASKAEFAVGAWLEIDKIEKALDSHTCGVERAFLFQGREYLFNSRMCISYEFRRFIPHATINANMAFHRKKAEEWLTHQASVAKRTMFGLQTITGQPNVTFARRPFFVFWFMSQVARALLLWSCDNTLTVALEVSKALIAPIEYLMSIWPCPAQQQRYQALRVRLDNACLIAGIAPPSPYVSDSSHISLS